MSLRPTPVLVAVTFLWGTTFVLTKDVVRTAPPVTYLAVRFTLAALVVLALFGRRAGMVRAARDGAVLGALNASGLLLQVIGQFYTTASKSAFLTSLNTPLVPLVGLALYHARPSRPQQTGVLLASLGLLLLSYPEGGARWNRGDLLTVGCATLYAFTIVETARRAPRHDALVLTTTQLAACALFFVTALGVAHAMMALLPVDAWPAAIRLEARPLDLDRRLVLEFVYLTVACTIVTFSAQTWALARMSATLAAIVFALEPVFALALALAVRGRAEWPGTRGMLGALAVLSAVVISQFPDWLGRDSTNGRARDRG